DLLVTADRSTKKADHWQPQFMLQHRASRPSRVEVVLAQHQAVVVGPGQQFDLLVVVGDQGNVPVRCHQFVLVGSVIVDSSSVLDRTRQSWVIVPARPGTIGKLGWVRSIAWHW